MCYSAHNMYPLPPGGPRAITVIEPIESGAHGLVCKAGSALVWGEGQSLAYNLFLDLIEQL
jgi:hypothetical protein